MRVKDLIIELQKIENQDATIKVCDLSEFSDGNAKSIVTPLETLDGETYFIDFDSDKGE